MKTITQPETASVTSLKKEVKIFHPPWILLPDFLKDRSPFNKHGDYDIPPKFCKQVRDFLLIAEF